MSTTPQLSGRAIAIAPAAQVPTPDGNDASVELMQYACTTCTRRKVSSFEDEDARYSQNDCLYGNR